MTTALDELLQRTTAMRGLARALVGAGAADDVLQEAAIETLVSPPRREGPAGGWLAAVVKNLARKHRRAERTRHRHEAAAARATTTAVDRSTEDADTLRRLTEIVTSLPEPYRGAILARYLRAETPSEIAAATGTPVRTVKTRLQRGLAMLRQQLAERDDDWRARLAAAFALEPLAATTTLLSAGTIMKLLLLTAALLPVGFWLWPDQGGVLRATPGDAAATAAAAPARANANGAPAGAPVATGEAPVDAPTAAVAAAPQDVALPGVAPLMRLDVAGPAAFRAAFRTTNLGGMFASGEGEKLWRPLLAPIEGIWRQWDGRDDGFAAARDRVLDYAGHVRVLWLVEPGKETTDDRVFGICALTMDGATDMATLADDLARVLRGVLPGEATERSAGELALQLLGDGGGDVVTVPILVEGALVAFFGGAATLGEDVPRCLEALAAAGPPPAAPLALHVDLAQLRTLEGPREEPALLRLFGLDSLQALDARVRPNGPYAELELEVGWGEGERGVFAGLLPDADTLPQLLGRLPMAATPWLAVPFRADTILHTVLEVIALERHEDGGLDAVRAEMREEFGFDLDTELLDHLGGEVMVLGDLWQADDTKLFRDGGDPPLGACVAFSLRDTAAFEQGFDKALDHLKGAVRRFETREVDGVKISRVGTAFATGIHLAVGKDLVALAFGEEGIAQLEALVTAAPSAGQPPLPAPIQHVRHLAPAGWNGVGLADLSALFGGQITLAMELLEDSLPPPMRPGLSGDATQEWLDQLLPLIAEHDLDRLVTMMGYADRTWRLRVLW